CHPTMGCAGSRSGSTPPQTTSRPPRRRSPTSRSSSAPDEVQAEPEGTAGRLAELPALDRHGQALAEVVGFVLGELEVADVAVAVDRERHRDLLDLADQDRIGAALRA